MKFNSLSCIFILAALLLTVYFSIPFREGHTISTKQQCAAANTAIKCGKKQGCQWEYRGWTTGECVTTAAAKAYYAPFMAEGEKLTKDDCKPPTYQWDPRNKTCTLYAPVTVGFS